MIALYRKGNTHIIRGVECEMQHFQVDRLEWATANGWSTTLPEDTTPIGEPVEPEVKAEDVEIQEPDVKIEEKAVSNDDVRLMAKDKGIDGWENKRIGTLKEQMGI